MACSNPSFGGSSGNPEMLETHSDETRVRGGRTRRTRWRYIRGMKIRVPSRKVKRKGISTQKKRTTKTKPKRR